MDGCELEVLLKQLISTWENEVVEFKEADNNYSTDKIGSYFSALANEANLRDAERAWLVFGVNNKTRRVVGSDYRPEHDRLQGLKMQITDNAEPRITFRNIYEHRTTEGRVVLFEIPASPKGIPIAWKGHYYARAGESLTSLSLDKLDEIRGQTRNIDWTAQVVPEAVLSHLDQFALQKAKEAYSRKYANRFSFEEINAWSLEAFLDRAGLTQEGRLTRTALLLLGKSESSFLLSPHPAQITWKLEGRERSYEHFGPPFLLATTKIYQRIRNVQIRILPEESLLPIEVAKYDQKVVLEALHNCIAHQDYNESARVVVTELPEQLIFENNGAFFEGVPEDYISGEKTPRRYRNPFLVKAMTELNMIDTMGYGIHEMHLGQARRYFPMPDYDLCSVASVRLTLHGRLFDPKYSRLLIQNPDLSLSDIIALDRVQKKLPIFDEAIRRLRRARLIEGRKPNFHISLVVAKATAQKEEYIRTRAQDDVFYSKLIKDYLDKFGTASRKEIDNLLWKKLSDVLDDEQKTRKVGNLLTNMRRAGIIRNTGSRRAPKWELV